MLAYSHSSKHCLIADLMAFPRRIKRHALPGGNQDYAPQPRQIAKQMTQ